MENGLAQHFVDEIAGPIATHSLPHVTQMSVSFLAGNALGMFRFKPSVRLEIRW